MQVAIFAAEVNVPAAQSVHTRSLVASPGVLTYLPATQGRQGVHDGAFSVVLNDPPAQALQLRLVVAEPGVLTYDPTPQLVHPTHGLAGF